MKLENNYLAGESIRNFAHMFQVTIDTSQNSHFDPFVASFEEQLSILEIIEYALKCVLIENLGYQWAQKENITSTALKFAIYFKRFDIFGEISRIPNLTFWLFRQVVNFYEIVNLFFIFK